MSRALVAVVSLAAVYVLMLVSLDPVDVATGVLLAVAVLTGLGRFLAADRLGDARPAGVLRRLAAVPGFAAVTVLDTVRGTWDVALVVLALRPLRRSGIVAIPFEGRTRSGAIVTGLTATLSPGEFLIDIDEERGVILMHVLDASDPDAVREQYRHRYERWQRKVAP